MLWPNRTFVNTPRHSSGLGLCPPSRRLLLAAVSRYPALAAALPHRGRSLAFLGEPSLPFGALTGGSLFSRPKERCPRRVTPSSCRPFVSFPSIFASSGRAAPPVVCVGVSPGPLCRPLAGPFCRRLPPPHGSAGCFHAVRICRRFWWPRSYLPVNGPFSFRIFVVELLEMVRRSLGDELLGHSVFRIFVVVLSMMVRRSLGDELLSHSVFRIFVVVLLMMVQCSLGDELLSHSVFRIFVVVLLSGRASWLVLSGIGQSFDTSVRPRPYNAAPARP
jgi:hypothetical protein